MVHEPEWRSRIAGQLSDGFELRDPEGSLVRSLAALPATVPAGELLGQVDGETRMVLADLIEEPWGQLDVDAIVSGALNALAGRGLEVEMNDLKRRLPLAPDSEKPALTRQLGVLSRRLSELKPSRWPVIYQGGRVGS
jgi:hypothetical protein